MKPGLQHQREKWCGCTFCFEGEGDRRPPHPFHENVLHPPMMINTFCEEMSENRNLILVVDDDCVEFEATMDIAGGEMFRVDYGVDYNAELKEDRDNARVAFDQAKKARRNRSFEFTCSKCGFQCQNKFRIKHYKDCAGRDMREPELCS